MDEWTLSLTGEKHLAPSTIRCYQQAYGYSASMPATFAMEQEAIVVAIIGPDGDAHGAYQALKRILDLRDRETWEQAGSA